MQNIYRYLLLVLPALFTGLLTAQNCQFELQLIDSFGDGWNGGEVTLTTGDQVSTYTLPDGTFRSVCVDVIDGEELTIGFVAGGFIGEVSLNIRDNAGEILFEANGGPMEGDTIFQTNIVCQSCVPPPFCGILETSRLRSSSVDLGWNSVPDPMDGNTPVYLVEFGPTGFELGTGSFLTTTDTMLRIEPLVDTTGYDIYISTICGGGTDTSDVRGPLNVFTPFTVDVGVTEVISPLSGCDLGGQQIELGITNFGGTAQSFIPFDYSINGLASGVNMPQDGLYTGVIGVDSTEQTTFDMTADFSIPGVYEVKIWTALPGDQDASNDTLTIQLTSTEVLSNLPYQEDFAVDGAGWTVDSDGEGEPSWAYGVANGSGTSAWLTNPGGNYNNNEISYLLSPCLDLSDVSQDLVFSFSLLMNAEACCDELYLESTVDGINWERVGMAGEGVNWYNDDVNQWWDGTAGLPAGYSTAIQRVSGLAGAPQARFRFVFSSDGSVTRTGAGIDNVYIGPQLENDLSASDVTVQTPFACGTMSDSVSLTFFNLGNNTAENISVSYQVNDGTIVTESFPDSLPTFATANYTFATTFDATTMNTNVIKAWVDLDGDGLADNDTLTITRNNALPIPLYEGFENGEPDGWNIDPSDNIGEAHDSGSGVIYDNLWASDQEFSFNTPNHGVIETGDTLFFDYRFVDFSGNTPTTLGTNDTFSVSLAIDCDTIPVEVFMVSGDLHTPSEEFRTVAISLEDYVGSNVQILFDAVWGEGDYFLDVDNINIRRCVETFAPGIIITEAATNGSSDGVIEIIPNLGTAPFTYLWDTGDETAILQDVPAGFYSVTVTDAQGCSESYTLEVEFLVSNRNFGSELGTVAAFPNPTAGALELIVDLKEMRELSVTVKNQLGQTIESRSYGQNRSLRENFDLSRYPAGMYFVQVLAGEQYQTLRVVKQ